MAHRFEDSHTLVLTKYAIEDQGIVTVGDFKIPILKGSKEDRNSRSNGVITDEILDGIIAFLKDANKKVPSRETENAIAHLEVAANFLVQRQLDRKKRKVSQTYKI